MGSHSDVPKVVVGLDFGTTFSGFAFAHRSNPTEIRSFYEWPFQEEAGAKPHCKTQTSLLYSVSDNIPSSSSDPAPYELQHWGWSALVNNVSAEGGVFITKFKLLLAQKHEHIPDGLTAEKLITDYLMCISQFVKEHMKLCYGAHFSEKDIQWCLTVPALWDDVAKKKMQSFAQAAGMIDHSHQLKIILEPEAASFYCQKQLKGVIKLKKGDTFLVADIGGGTIDIVVHKKARKLGIKVDESAICSGALGGGTFVDENMLNLFKKKIGCLELFLTDNNKMLLQILKWWNEEGKCSFDGSPDLSISWNVPQKLFKAWKEYDLKQGIVRDEAEYEQLQLNVSEMKQIFDPEIDKVISLISDQLDRSSGRIKFIFLVGGFSENPYLVKQVRTSFKDRVQQIIVPSNPGAAVCNGAVMLGFDESLVLSRISKKTYGMKSAREFEVGDPLQFMAIDERGCLMCTNVFDIYVRKNESVPYDHTVQRVCSPVSRMQRTMPLVLFSSNEVNPEYITEPGCRMEASFDVDISEGMEELGRNRLVLVSMFFGRASVEVSAKRLNFGDRSTEKVCSVMMDMGSAYLEKNNSNSYHF